MATDKNTLKNWFKTGLKPLQAHFWAWLDSYWHKSDKIPMQNIEGIGTALENKAETTAVNAKANADASGLGKDNVLKWKKALGVGELPKNIATIDKDGVLGDVYDKTQVDDLLENSGTNIGNADMKVPEGEERTLDLTGSTLKFKGVQSAQGDASFNKRPKFKGDGTFGMVDENTVIKEDAMKALALMSDVEKDAFRRSMLKSNERYSTNAPRVDVILPFIVKKENYVQYISVKGMNLFLDPSASSVYVINNTTGEEYLIDNMSTSAADPTMMVFGFNFNNLPSGDYRLKIVNNGLTNLDKTLFTLVEELNFLPQPNLTWQTISREGWLQNPSTIAYSNGVKWAVGLDYAKFGGTGVNVNSIVFNCISNEDIISPELMRGNWVLYLKSVISGAGFGGVSSYQGGYQFGLKINADGHNIDSLIDYGTSNESQVSSYTMPRANKSLYSTKDGTTETIIVKKDNIIKVMIIKGGEVAFINTVINTPINSFKLLASFKGCSALQNQPQYSKDIAITSEVVGLCVL